ncbi:MAG: YqhA family protein [Anaerolineae bacterium]|nr:YqhA family protein [Anaerolineae bacterium]
MKTLLEKTKYLTLLAVFPSLIAALAAYLLGIVRTVNLITDLLGAFKGASYTIVALIEIADIFLIATSLLIFALSIYELFIGELDLPEWLVIHKFTELKDKLSSVVVLVMAISVLKYMLDSQKSPQDILAFGLGAGSVIVALGVYARLAEKATSGEKK